MGAVVGAIASGRVPAGGVAGDPWHSWVNPTSVLGGVLAVVVVAYLAAFYLVWDARRLVRRARWSTYFRIRAIGSAVAAGVVAFVGIFVLHADADYLFDGLTHRALPLVIISSALRRQRTSCCSRAKRHRGARFAAIGAVGSIIVAWGVAQWDYILPETLTVDQAAAPSGTLTAVLVATGLAVVLIFPSLALLYSLDQHGLLPEEGLDTRGAAS